LTALKALLVQILNHIFLVSRWMFQPVDKDMTLNDLIHFGFFC
jgi:hypothetical protein